MKKKTLKSDRKVEAFEKDMLLAIENVMAFGATMKPKQLVEYARKVAEAKAVGRQLLGKS